MAQPRKFTPHGERAELRKEVEKLKLEIQLQSDEIKGLKAEARSYQEELRRLQSEVQTYQEESRRLQSEVQTTGQQALQETLAGDIGKQVRLRYLEQHRYRMNRGIGKVGLERIKAGDRAAHRGRPVIDALLCLTRVMTDPKVYEDLYGVTPVQMVYLKDVAEVVEIASFHASLQSEDRMTYEFKAVFKRLCDMARSYASPADLRAGFCTNGTLQQLQAELQDRYDRIVAAHPRGQQRSPPSQYSR